MGNKLKNIKLVNILLEQKYLREQATTNSGVAQTGTTTSQTQVTPPQSGQTQVTPPQSGQTQVNTTTPQTQNTTLTTDQIVKIKDLVDKSKITKCSKGGLPLVATYKDKNIHSFGDNSFCIG
jgi:hypothetical protein